MIRLLVPVLLALAVAGCGEDIDPAADRERAEDARPDEDDFPDDFEESDDSDDEDEADDPIGGGCVEGLDEEGFEDAQTASEEATFTGEDGNVQVEVAIRIFDDEGIASALVRVLDEEGIDCLIDRAEETAEDEGTDLEADTADPPDVDDVGDESTAAALDLTVEAEGGPVDLEVELYAARVGRSFAGITVTRGEDADYDEDDAADLMETVIERLES